MNARSQANIRLFIHDPGQVLNIFKLGHRAHYFTEHGTKCIYLQLSNLIEMDFCLHLNAISLHPVIFIYVHNEI